DVVHFVFSSRRRHTRSKRDWSSDVCSSDLEECTGTSTGNVRPTFLNSNRVHRNCRHGHGRSPKLPSRSYTDPSKGSIILRFLIRSEERRVGKECRSLFATDAWKNTKVEAMC